MAQGSLKLARANPKGGRQNNKHASKMKKGNLVRKPRKQKLAELNNKSKKLTAAIGRNIEKATGKVLAQNGGNLSLLKRVSRAAKDGGDEAKKTAKTPKFDTRKQFMLTSKR